MPTTLTSILQLCTRIANLHPYTWYLGWQAVWHMRFLLPHEQGFRALRHFIAIKPEGLFLDVGANNGISALSLRRYSSDYRIVSIEPNPLLEPYLKKIKAKDNRFDYVLVGAGSAASRARFFVPTYNGVVLHTATSAIREQVFAAISHWFSPAIAARTTVTEVECPIIPLDDLALDPSIVKIDAEGYDYDALVGLSKTIDRCRPIIINEMEWVETGRVESFLAERNYKHLAYNPATDLFKEATSFDPSLGHNAFFVPAELSSKLPGLA